MSRLFSRVSIFDVLRHRESALKAAVNQLDAESLQAMPEEELVRDLASDFKLQVPVLEEENASTSHREVDIDVSQDPMRMIFDRGHPFFVKGTQITISIPFKGDSDMFQITPSTFSTSPPQGEVQGGDILLRYTRTDNNAGAIKTDYERTLTEIKKHLSWLGESVADFNTKIGEQVRALVTGRRQQLAAAARMVVDIGLPVKQKGQERTIRSPATMKAMTKGINSSKKWDVFISHASEDKDQIARPLALALRARGIPVWYDEFSLKVGDSLRASIDYGLANSRYGVVILSKDFFARHWPVQELNGLAGRESEGRKVILPVWHEVSEQEVRTFSPMLADRIAAKSDAGVEKIVEQIVEALE